MIGYITIGARDPERAKTFYDAVLATVGWKQFADYGGYIGYGLGGSDQGQTIWLCKPFDNQPARAGNGIMIGFHADTKEQVHAFHAAAMAADGTDEGGPDRAPITARTGTPPIYAIRRATSCRSCARRRGDHPAQGRLLTPAVSTSLIPFPCEEG